MPTVNFSSPFWQATFTNGTEFCGDATGVGEAVDPDTGTIIQMLTGVMKMANVNNELVLGVSALTCNSFNPGVIPTVECRVLLPRAFVFTQFRFDPRATWELNCILDRAYAEHLPLELKDMNPPNASDIATAVATAHMELGEDNERNSR